MDPAIDRDDYLADDPDDDRIVVLHVDDEPALLDLVAEFLERIDDRITTISETEPGAALERLEAAAVDCIVSDYQMPGTDGIEFLRAVRESYPNLPFFLFTGRGSEDVASEAIDAGVTSYIQKGGTEAYDQLANRIGNAVERRRSERFARIARDRLLALFEQTDGFYILDGDWEVLYWNQQIAERTGLPSEAVLGEVFWEVFPEATETEVYDRFRAAARTGGRDEFEIYYEPHGYWAEVRVYPVDGGLFVHSRDISGAKEREQELERRNHILESFANTVSHDLRNPLNLAEGKLRLAQETGDFDHLEGVAEAHNRMRNLIDELLRLARGEELSLTEVELSAAADAAWDTVSADGAALEVDADGLRFEAHETQLRRLFENLFWNAIDHGGAGTIRVGGLDDGFYVEDDGDGIRPADRERVFRSGFSTDADSPGYGLSIVDGIAETHGWSIEVAEGDAGGARFEVTGVTLLADD